MIIHSTGAFHSTPSKKIHRKIWNIVAFGLKENIDKDEKYILKINILY